MVLCAAALGCGDDRATLDAAAPDAAREAAAPDAAIDSAPLDASADAAVDAPVDAPVDARLLGLGDPCELPDGGDLPCQSGLLCCTPCCGESAQAVCTRPAANDAGIGVGECPLPDLAINQERLRSELGIGTSTFSSQGCSVMEGCVDAPGTRRLLNFSVVTPNVGTADLFLGDPNGNPLFVYSPCHMHYHFSGYALYRLLDSSGNEVLRGRKRAFCLEDFEPQPDPPLGGPGRPRYDCGNQGISMGWEDAYFNGLSCQFMDITDVPPGHYTLEVTINPDHLLRELRYDNNQATVEFDLAAMSTNPTDACTGSVSGLNRECGWTNGGTFSCAPGAQIHAGCGCGVGACTGDTIARICAGTSPCSETQSLGEADDSCGGSNCSLVSFTCPPSGQYTVLYGAYTTTDAITCTVGHNP
jgi:hypothetical protein